MNDLDKELSELGKLHKDIPALKEAYEQIEVIRTLMDACAAQRNNVGDLPQWQQSYFKVTDQHDADDANPAVLEAWEKYYMLKNLML